MLMEFVVALLVTTAFYVWPSSAQSSFIHRVGAPGDVTSDLFRNRIRTSTVNLIDRVRTEQVGTTAPIVQNTVSDWESNSRATITLWTYSSNVNEEGCGKRVSSPPRLPAASLRDNYERLYSAYVLDTIDQGYRGFLFARYRCGITMNIEMPENSASSPALPPPDSRENSAETSKENKSITIQSNSNLCSMTMMTSGRESDLFSRLGSGQSLRSVNKEHMLVMQSDCNLVLYLPWVAWASDTQDAGHGCYLRTQYDRNVVIYSKNHIPVWEMKTGCDACMFSTSLHITKKGRLELSSIQSSMVYWMIK